jgi:hypothetical protein
MIYPTGYTPLYGLFHNAKVFIRRRIRDRERELRAEGTKPADVDVDRNVEGAAQYLLLDLFGLCRAPGESIRLLRRDGSLVNADLGLLDPAGYGMLAARRLFEDAAKEAGCEGIFTRPERAFGLQSMRSTYWHDTMLLKPVFPPDKAASVATAVRDVQKLVGIINWTTGCVSTREMEILANATTALKSVSAQLQGIGIRVGLPWLDKILDDGRDREMHAILAMFAPLDGCPVVIPNDWVNRFYSELDGKQDLLSSPERDSRSPKDAILALKSDDPALTKDEIKERLFPDLSWRQFDIHWRQASEADPGISKAGRRKAKS